MMTTLDVTREDEAERVVREAEERFGQIDVVVNNAGFGLLGAIEESSDAQVQSLFHTNVGGVLNVLRAILPGMRQRQRGHIINVSSTGGIVASAGSGVYAASKFAVEGLSEALAQELRPFGINVTVLEPGYFRTDFLSERSIACADTVIADYGRLLDRSSAAKMDGRQRGDPAKAALAILEAVDAQNPPFRLALGPDSVRRIEGKLHDVQAELDAWRSLSLSTDHDDVQMI
jgi:short-subunit dehydrogenase